MAGKALRASGGGNNKNYRLSAPWWCCRGRRRFVGGWVWLCACGASEA
ncbi:hypothetical protein ABM278_004826 [Salmonella enterica]